ncbi:hypothetical protein CL622_06100 [archaeon]|nr:hypothetical protein [archaeon]|tara:strand:+ start:477 stop:863 length:387 start_codon:yes stop_codon:yes gene_type:complete
MQVTRKKNAEFTDERGIIANLLPEGVDIKSVLYITSKAGSIRSNHYHKKDTHFCYILSGKAEWHEKPVDAPEGTEIEKEVLGVGDMVFTPAMIIHGVKFLEDTVFLAFATESRDQENYEEDTVRVELI